MEERGRQDVETEVLAVGVAIRGLRRQQGLSLRELSQRCGLSVGFLSQVERGLASPALTSVHVIARALGTDMSRLFSLPAPREAAPAPYLHRGTDGDGTVIQSSGRIYSLLSGRASDLALEPMLVTIPPGSADDEPYSHDREEFAYILSGSLRYLMNGQEYRLHPGDSIHFRSTVPHAIANDGEVPVVAVWVITPRVL